jgi:hypothetical protein
MSILNFPIKMKPLGFKDLKRKDVVYFCYGGKYVEKVKLTSTPYLITEEWGLLDSTEYQSRWKIAYVSLASDCNREHYRYLSDAGILDQPQVGPEGEDVKTYENDTNRVFRTLAEAEEWNKNLPPSNDWFFDF